MREQGAGYFYSLIGVLGWLDTWLPRWIYMTYLPILVAVALFDSACKSKVLHLWEKAYLLAICCVCFCLITMAQYLSWTKPGAPVVEGVQGRYFIPLVMPALLILSNRIKPHRIKWLLGGIVTVYSALVLRATCLAVFSRYYG
jgi:uncharacterized membrane protein